MDINARVNYAISQFKDFEPSIKQTDTPSPTVLSQFIDHTLLKPDATESDIRKLCEEAVTYNFETVCVNSSWVKICNDFFSNRSTSCYPIAVVGFPFGAAISEAKAFEAKAAIDAGAKEIDMVLHIGKLREGSYTYVLEDIEAVYQACGPIPLKVIFETSMLRKEEIIAACAICKEVGVAFVKTSTGFGGGGASVTDVALMKAVVGEGIEVKASGGIRTYEDALRMYNAGARRIGASASVAIVTKKVGVTDY
jgi:deoxyribose-phosphate aldolase